MPQPPGTKDIENYISQFPAEVRADLQKVPKTISVAGDLRASLRRTIQVGDDDFSWPSDEIKLILAFRPSRRTIMTVGGI